jgi:hypothetical protein
VQTGLFQDPKYLTDQNEAEANKKLSRAVFAPAFLFGEGSPIEVWSIAASISVQRMLLDHVFCKKKHNCGIFLTF